MKRFYTILVVAAVLVFSTLLMAQLQPVGPLSANEYVTVIDGQSLAAEPSFNYSNNNGASYVTKINVKGLNQVNLLVAYDRNGGAATYIYAKCKSYLYGDSTAYYIQALDGSAGIDADTDFIFSAGDYTFKRSVDTSRGFDFPMPIQADYLDCELSADDATSDKVSVSVRAGAI